jgi:lysyl-tRNA synthetase class II
MVTAAHLSDQVSLHRHVLSTARGPWLIHVNSVLTAKESDNASLQLVLKNLSDEARSKNRWLYLVVSAPSLEIPQERVAIVQRIRRWVETTSGNGFLDLAGGRGRVVSGRTNEAPTENERGGVGPPPGDRDRRL